MKIPCIYLLTSFLICFICKDTFSQHANLSKYLPQKDLTLTSPQYRRAQAQNSENSSAWTRINNLTTDPLDYYVGFSNVGDSIIWSPIFDIAAFQGITPSPKKVLSKSIDGGRNWETIPIELPDSSLRYTQDSVVGPTFVAAVDPEVIWVALSAFPFLGQDYGILVKSKNGGEDWERVPLPFVDSAEIPLCIHFWNRDTGVVFSNGFPPRVPLPVQIYYTEDGGATFTNVSPPLDSAESRWINSNNIYDVQGDTIWYGTRKGRILRSEDKGKSWSVFPTEFSGNVTSVAFMNSLEGIAVIELGPDGGLLPSATLQTEDGGETWSQIKAPSIIETVEYVPASGGVYIGSTGNFAKRSYAISKDKGETWTFDVPTPFSSTLRFFSPTLGFIGDLNLRDGLNRYMGEPLLFDASQEETLLFEAQATDILPPHTFVSDLHAVNDQVLWGVANDRFSMSPPVAQDHSPLIMKSIDGGDSWEVQVAEEIQGRISYDIYAFNEDTAWITTNNLDSIPGKGVYMTVDGGETWEERYADFSGGTWIHWFDKNEGIVINRESFSKSIDGGVSWEPIDSSSIPPFEEEEFTIFKSAENAKAIVGDHMWFGTNKGRLYHSADRGSNWEILQVLPDSNGRIMTVAFADTLNGLLYVSEESNGAFIIPPLFRRTRDGGKSWEELPPINNPVYSLEYVPGSDHTYIVSSDFGNFLGYTTDGGDSWLFAPDIGSYLTLEFLNPTTGWVTNFMVDSIFFPPVLKYIGEPFPKDVSVSTPPLIQEIDVRIYPNPTNQMLYIDSEEEFSYIGLIDIQGKKIMLASGSQSTYWEGDLTDISAGTYWLELYLGKKRYLKLLTVQ